MQHVAIRILHPEPLARAGPLEHALATARRANAERLAARFRESGAADVRIEAGPPDGRPFGERLRRLVRGLPSRAGLVVLGSGSIPLATRADAAAFVGVAASGARSALANNFYSADVVAIGDAAASLTDVPDLPSDNALPRWLAEAAGYEVRDRRRSRRLGVDLDSPLDVLLVGGSLEGGVDASIVRSRLDGLRAVTANPNDELVIAGRTSASTLRWLERATASRTRAIIEERGLRATGIAPSGGAHRRAPRSLLGQVLDQRGEAELGAVLAELGDGAVVDTRVLLAHRLGGDEAAWPSAEDRFAADLLLADDIADPWLRALTASARDASIPIALGGHTLVGPGLPLALRRLR